MAERGAGPASDGEPVSLQSQRQEQQQQHHHPGEGPVSVGRPRPGRVWRRASLQASFLNVPQMSLKAASLRNSFLSLALQKPGLHKRLLFAGRSPRSRLRPASLPPSPRSWPALIPRTPSVRLPGLWRGARPASPAADHRRVQEYAPGQRVSHKGYISVNCQLEGACRQETILLCGDALPPAGNGQLQPRQRHGLDYS